MLGTMLATGDSKICCTTATLGKVGRGESENDSKHPRGQSNDMIKDLE